METEFKTGDRVTVTRYGGVVGVEYNGKLGTVTEPCSSIGYVAVRLDEDPWGANAYPLLCLVTELKHIEEKEEAAN